MVLSDVGGLAAHFAIENSHPGNMGYSNISPDTDPAVTASLQAIGPQRGFNKGFDAS